MEPLSAQMVKRAGQWSGAPLDEVTLDYDGRHRRRVMLACASGRRVLLDLAEATVLRDGDGLETPDGVILVRAADETLDEITCASAPELMRLAWHLGNRHLATEIHGDRLLIRHDHVIADMAERLGGRVRPVRAPFNPEGGAYGGDHGHHHHGTDADG
jgi:urease accessory protein